MKSQHKAKLQQDLVKYSKQIGILDNEIPRLIFNRNEANALAEKHNVGARRVVGKNKLGQCLWSLRTIFVNERPKTNVIYRKVLSSNGKKYVTKVRGGDTYYKLKGGKWNYREQLHTLVHELVHYRFGSSMRHGYKFDQTIKDILAGKTFPPQHVHLFANYRKWYIQNIEGGQ